MNDPFWRSRRNRAIGASPRAPVSAIAASRPRRRLRQIPDPAAEFPCARLPQEAQRAMGPTDIATTRSIRAGRCVLPARVSP